MSPIEQAAREEIAAHGKMAPHYLVERIVEATQRDDNAELDRLDRILQEVDRLQRNRFYAVTEPLRR